MNEFNQESLISLEEKLRNKIKERDILVKQLREEADSSMNSMVYYMLPSAIIGILALIFIIMLECS